MKQQIKNKLFDRLFILEKRERMLEMLYRDSDYPKSKKATKLLIATTKKISKIKNLTHQ